MYNKILCFMMAAAIVSVGFAQSKTTSFKSLSDVRAKYSAIIANPQLARSEMEGLSPEDQLKFVAEINNSIDKMPGKKEENAAKFVAFNRNCVLSAAKGAKLQVLAEVFATVPPYALTVLNERFAQELFNRASDTSVSLTDEQYEAISKRSMEIIVKRAQEADDSSVRQAFAALMFIRASNGSPANLKESLSAMISDEKARAIALNEWIKPALGDGAQKTYEPMLGVSNFEGEFIPALALDLLGNPTVDSCLMQLDAVSRAYLSPTGIGLPLEKVADFGIGRVPRTFDTTKPYHPSNNRGYRYERP